MSGIQAHISSSLEGVRQVGMAVGEILMNRLHPLPNEHKLKFDYQPNLEVMDILQLARYSHTNTRQLC